MRTARFVLMRGVKFNSTDVRDIACPCHGVVYDPYNNAQLMAGEHHLRFRRFRYNTMHQPATSIRWVGRPNI